MVLSLQHISTVSVTQVLVQRRFQYIRTSGGKPEGDNCQSAPPYFSLICQLSVTPYSPKPSTHDQGWEEERRTKKEHTSNSRPEEDEGHSESSIFLLDLPAQHHKQQHVGQHVLEAGVNQNAGHPPVHRQQHHKTCQGVMASRTSESTPTTGH